MSKNDLPVIAKAKEILELEKTFCGLSDFYEGSLGDEKAKIISKLLEVIEVQREALNKIDRDAECWSEMIDIAQDAIAEADKILTTTEWGGG